MMRLFKLAMAAAVAVGISGVASADDAAFDSVHYPWPLPSQETGALTYAPADNAAHGPFATMPASPWVQQRFSANQNLSTINQDSWMLRQTDWVPPGSAGE